MAKTRVTLQSLGLSVEVERGSQLFDVLFRYGVEFPCGGSAQCRGCRVRVVEGELAEGDADRELLSAEERAQGWRVACRAKVSDPVTLEVRQWSGPILTDESPVEFEPQNGVGIAIDLGTTTLVAQLVDLGTGAVLATQTALNPQSGYGADVMTRIHFALQGDGLERLRDVVQTRIRGLVRRLMRRAPASTLERAVIVGNTVMQHLFFGFDVATLARTPFESPHRDAVIRRGSELGWEGPAADANVVFLPNLGSFVGSDIVGVILATALHQSDVPVCAADLGTNGEIVVSDGRRILVTSTAAGPAFEGAKISQGMRASIGAIDRVSVQGGVWNARVIGGGRAKGICGSGLVDAVAAGLSLERISATGRMIDKRWTLVDSVALDQKDVRELQLAKGAIAAGVRILADVAGVELAALRRLFLAGAFGNTVDRQSAIQIGLLPVDVGRIEPVGNAALRGAKVALLRRDFALDACADIARRSEHVSLERHPQFQDWYADEMAFPELVPALAVTA